MKKIV